MLKIVSGIETRASWEIRTNETGCEQGNSFYLKLHKLALAERTRAKNETPRETEVSIYLLIVVADSFHANRKHADHNRLRASAQGNNLTPLNVQHS